MLLRRSIGRADQRGQSLVELALSVPLLLAMVFGAVELGSAYNAYITLVSASREGARLASRGNIFPPDDVLLVVREHSPTLDITNSGTVVVTTVRTESTGITSYSSNRLIGTADSRFNPTNVLAAHDQATTSDPGYLRKDYFVIVEIIYEHRTVTGFFSLTIPMYAYTIMPVSAPS